MNPSHLTLEKVDPDWSQEEYDSIFNKPKDYRSDIRTGRNPFKKPKKIHLLTIKHTPGVSLKSIFFLGSVLDIWCIDLIISVNQPKYPPMITLKLKSIIYNSK